ncbi:uncharacterized protein LOC119069405 [Bradysia coprophila]|uniref:uncharacterized protein LOC119069405 n=1 Tax=Bradysia coprophila TaxID=38358 RepID=UPI00187D91C5|nr:uncharacterized protein LOC119069405 [Bradysia coprophila]
MLLSTRVFVVNLNQKLLVPLLYRHQMAPVTRKPKMPASGNVFNKTNSTDKVTKRVILPKKLRSVDVNKPKCTAKSQHTSKDGLPIIAFQSENELESWLRTNHTVTTGLWVKIAKKCSGIQTVTYDELLDVVLCYGWIDGQRCSLDETWFLQRITPRRPKSNWSQINRERVKRLIRVGRMQSAGQCLIDDAKADGRWDKAYKPSSGCVVPDELTAAVEDASPSAIDSFRTLSKPDKLILINRIERTTTVEERSECIRSIVEMLVRGEAVTESA